MLGGRKTPLAWPGLLVRLSFEPPPDLIAGFFRLVMKGTLDTFLYRGNKDSDQSKKQTIRT